MKILVTGALGNIGTNLVNELQGRGHEVFGVDLINSNRNNYERCDVKNYRQLENIFSKNSFDFVYHLAAEYGRWNGESYYENLWETNAIGTKNILRLQKLHKFKLIFFSSCEVYGDYNGLMSEDVMINNPIVDTYQMNDYAITKWAGELMCLNEAAMNGNEIVRVRPLNCYGPHEHFTPFRGFIPKFIYLALNNITFDVHKGHKRIIDYVEDSCNTFANIVNNFIPGEVYNVGGRVEWEMSIEDYAKIVLKATGRDDLAINFHDAEPFTTVIKTVDFSKAISDLDHDPKIDPEKGIQLTSDWMRDVYRIKD